MHALLKAAVSRLLDLYGYEAFYKRGYYSQDGLRTVHEPRFLTLERFTSAYARGVEASAGFDPQFAWRVHCALWAAAEAARGPDGDFVECGVNAGFMSSAILRYLDWNRNAACAGRSYFLVDTFQGPVLEQFSGREISSGRRQLAEDSLSKGAYVTNMDRVRANFVEWNRVEIVQGVIPDVLPEAMTDVRPAFLHVDLNCVLPEVAALEYFWPRMAKGSIVLLDDYCFRGHGEQGDAADSFAARCGVEILALPTGQGLIIR